MCRVLIFLLLTSVIVCSCKRNKTDEFAFLNDTDTIKIFYNVLDSSFKPKILPLNKKNKDLFRQVLNSESKDSYCPYIQTIKFYSKGEEKFEVGYINSTNPFLIIDNHGKNECHRLTYNLSMFLDQQ